MCQNTKWQFGLPIFKIFLIVVSDVELNFFNQYKALLNVIIAYFW